MILNENKTLTVQTDPWSHRGFTIKGFVEHH